MLTQPAPEADMEQARAVSAVAVAPIAPPAGSVSPTRPPVHVEASAREVEMPAQAAPTGVAGAETVAFGGGPRCSPLVPSLPAAGVVGAETGGPPAIASSPPTEGLGTGTLGLELGSPVFSFAASLVPSARRKGAHGDVAGETGKPPAPVAPSGEAGPRTDDSGGSSCSGGGRSAVDPVLLGLLRPPAPPGLLILVLLLLLLLPPPPTVAPARLGCRGGETERERPANTGDAEVDVDAGDAARPAGTGLIRPAVRGTGRADC